MKRFLFVVGLTGPLLLAACSTPGMVAGEDASEEASEEASISQSVTSIAGAITVWDLPEVQEVGLWWLVPQSEAVIRGRLSSLIETVPWGNRRLQIWNLEVTTSILGGLQEGASVRLIREDPALVDRTSNPVARQLAAGTEAIFFLVPFEVGPGVGPADLYAARLGDGGIITDQLTDRTSKLLAGSDALAVGRPRGTELLNGTRFAVVAEPGAEVSTGNELGWDYIEFEASVKEVIWTFEGLPEAGVPPDVAPESFTIRVALEVADRVLGQGPQIFLLEGPVRAQDSGRVAFMPSGGDRIGILPLDSNRSDLVEALEGAHDLKVREAARLERGQATLDHARALLAAQGEIPVPPEVRRPEIEPAPPPGPPIEVDYRQPFTVTVGEFDVQFDRWFWVLLDREASVVIFRDGEIVLQGPMFGEGAVMLENTNGDMIFGDPLGTTLVQITSEQMSAAIGEYISGLSP